MNPLLLPQIAAQAGPAVTPLFNVPMDKASAPIDPRISEDQYVERSPRHRGGAGLARDILGTLGDFLLTRLRMPAMYAPAQRQRRLEAAIQGFDQDPTSAINRVTDVDFDAGSRLRAQYTDDQRLAQAAASAAEARAGRLSLADEMQRNRNRGIAASYLGSLVNTPEENRSAAYSTIRNRLMTAYGTRDEELASLLPESYDPVIVDAFIDGAVPVGTQRQQRLTEARHEVLEDQGQQRIQERGRHNRATEGQGDRRIDETGRHNRTTEGQGSSRIRETGRHNRATEGQGVANAAERGRHNRSMEAIRRPPVEGERRVIGGRTYVWRNGRAVLER